MPRHKIVLSRYSKWTKYVFTNVFKGNEIGGDDRFNSNNMSLLDKSLQYVRGMIHLFLPREELVSDLYTDTGNENMTIGNKNLLDCNA